MALTYAASGGRHVKTAVPTHPQMKLLLAAACKEGDLLGYSSGWVLADGDVGAGPIHPQFIAMSDGAIGGTISVCTSAHIFGGLTAGTTGAAIHPGSNPGEASETRLAATNAREFIGTVMTATSIYVQVDAGVNQLVA